jgi:ribosomal-protein-alanine N-acetyltransferase
VEIFTERLRLRELTEADAPACNAYERDPEVVRYTSHGEHTLEETLARLRRIIAATAAVPRVVHDFAVVLRGTHDEGRLLGRAGFHLGRPEAHQAEIWWILHRDHWGRGYAPEAARALLDLAFGALDVHRVIADLDPANVASARVAEKLGMRREGHFLENTFQKGAWVDTLIYAILRREWAAKAARL